MQKANQKELKIEKVIKRKGDNLYVKWKGYDNSFNTWINKKRYCYTKIDYFPPYCYSKNKNEVELDSPNFVAKSEFKTQQV